MSEAIEILNELEVWLNTANPQEVYNSESWVSRLEDFIDNQRSIYQPARGECAV